MISDVFTYVSTAQVVTATAVSTDSIDLSAARDLGPGRNFVVLFETDTTATAAGAATVTFEVITATDAALTTSVQVVGSSRAYALAELTASGTNVHVDVLPTHDSIGQRYLGVRYSVATGPLTAGAFTARFGFSASTGQKVYPSGYSTV